MRREKQIIKEAESLIDPYEMFIDWEYERGLKEGFVKGAKWADDTMIDKACEWLEDKLRMYAGCSDTADLVDSFRKAMEE
jgi:hypothetical protein